MTGADSAARKPGATEFSPLSQEIVQDGTATARELAMNLITAGLGTGIFTLPWSTAGSSALPAILIIGVVLTLNAWTISLIVQAGERHQTFNLGALLGRLPGNSGVAAEAAVNVFLCVSQYLCLVSYVIVMADCFHTSLPFECRRSLFVLAAAVIVLPLCFLDQSRLSFTSTAAVLAIANIFANIAAQFVSAELTGSQVPVCYFGVSTGSIAMFSAMMQTVIIQMCALPMYQELENRSPAKFCGIVNFSFGVLFVLCSAFAVIGYFSFGKAVHSNVLLNLPNTHMGHISRLGAAVSVAAVYPIIMNPMTAPLRTSSVVSRFGSGVASFAVVCIVAASAAAALVVQDLGFVNVVNGALSCGVFVALAPSLVGLNLLGQRSQKTVFRGLMYCLIAGGLLFAALGLIVTDNYADSLASTCAWGRHGAHFV